MHWNKGWNTAGLLGIMLLCTASMHPIPLAKAQTQPSAPVTECLEQQGQTLERLTRDLIYRSHGYVNSGQFDEAARSLDRALQLAATVEDPFSKTDLIANIAGETGGQPSTMEQLIDYAVTTQQPDIPLNLLPKVVAAAQTLDGEYGVINVKRAVLVRLAQDYIRLEQPDQARSLLDQARQLLNSLQGDGFGLIAAPVAEGYATLGDQQSAIEILNQALQLTEAMTTNDQDYLADIFSKIATAYSKAGADQQALKVAERIQVPQVKARTLAAIARQAAQTGSSAQANLILTQAQELTSTVPEALRLDVLSQIALAYAHSGQWDTALDVADTIASAEIKIRTLAQLASAHDRANRPAAAAEILNDLAAIARTIEPFYDGDTLLREVFAEYLANQQYTLAFQFSQTLDETLQHDLLLKLIAEASAAEEFAIALQAAEVMPPGWENQTRYLALRSIVAGYAEAGQYEQAVQLLQQIQDSSDYPSHTLARVAIAQSYRKAGQPEQALEQLNQALQSLTRLNDTSAKLEAQSLITVQLAQLQQMDRAIEVQTQALATAKALNPYGPLSYGIEQLVTHYLSAGEYPLALQLVQSLETEIEHDRLLQVVLQQMLEVGELQAVRQAADQIRNPNQQVAFWVKLSDYYRGLGQLEPAAEVLAQAFAIAQSLPGPDENTFAEAAQIDPSVPIWDDFDRGSLLESIAIRYAELGQQDVAHQIAQALRSPTDQERLIQRLACYG